MEDSARRERQSRDAGEGYLSLHLELAQLCSRDPWAVLQDACHLWHMRVVALVLVSIVSLSPS